MENCPFCKQQVREIRAHPEHGSEFECSRCGLYSLSTMLQSYGEKDSPPIESAHLISGMISHKWAGRGYFDSPHFASKADFKRVAANAPSRVQDRAGVLVEEIERRTKYLGQNVSVGDDSWIALSFAQNLEECLYLLRYIHDLGWVKSEITSHTRFACLTPKGFEEIDGARRSNLNSEKVFVAMWFPDKKSPDDRVEMDRAWMEGIKPALEAAGFDPVRIDWDEHNEDINNRIKARIGQSRFLVADCTGHRNGSISRLASRWD